MHIFLINLPRSTGRRRNMEQQLNQLGLPFEIITAFDGHQNDYQYHVDENHGFERPFSNTEVGCFLSHRAALQGIVAKQLPYALILEDDVQLSPHLPRVLASLERLYLKPGQVISLFAALPEPSEFNTVQALDAAYRLTRPDPNTLVVGNQAYIVTYQAAVTLLASTYPMQIHCDQWSYFRKNGFIQDFQVLFPHPVDVSGDYSDIHESTGGPLLRFKKFLLAHVPPLGNLIRRKRRNELHALRATTIRVDGYRPPQLFY